MKINVFYITCILPTLHISDENDLFEVTENLLRLDKDQIYNLGLVLGLSLRKVKGMEDSTRFLDEMITAWLRREDQVYEYSA